MDIELGSVTGYGLSEATELLNRGFVDYFLKIEFDVASLLHMVCHDGIDIASSRIVSQDGKAVGVALIARRGWTSRLAGMAIVPEARGKGIGKWLMEQLISEAKERGERTMVLEVVEQNAPGVRLYQGCGFRALRQLVGYAVAEPEGVGGELKEIDVREAARMATMYGLPDLPWQVSGESLSRAGPPGKAYRMGSAYVAISDPERPHAAIRTIVVEPEARKQGQATRLLRAVTAEHPGKTWIVPALCPAEIGGVFEKVGFEKEDLSQLQMTLELK
ncbi:MAG: GNAT family N-acetyltransferase [Chloroflexota bacterium]|nr:GNAT family N-acetyltransferase [Chloroflexota bacterium]